MKLNNFLILAPLLAMPLLGRADGGGIHGPDLAPTPIELGDANGIPAGVQDKLALQCAVRGSEKDRKESLLASVGRQVFPDLAFRKEGKISEIYPRVTKDEEYISSYTGIEIGSNYTHNSWDGETRLKAWSRKIAGNDLYFVRHYDLLFNSSRWGRNYGKVPTGTMQADEFNLTETAWYQRKVGDALKNGPRRVTQVDLKLPKAYTLPWVTGTPESRTNPTIAKNPPYYQPIEGPAQITYLAFPKIIWEGELQPVNLVSAYDPDEHPTPVIVDMRAYADCLIGAYQKAASQGFK